MTCYDLHSHSYYSDGILPPADLVARAATQGVDVLALTDHDITDGIAEAQQAASSEGIEVVPGVEISVTWENRTLHILGLRIDPAHAELQQGLQRIRNSRDERAVKIGEQLEKRGIGGALEAAQTLAQGKIVSRTHFAQFLLNEGHAKDFQRAFRDWLGEGRPGYVKTRWAALDGAVGWINASGGQAVIAHPGRYRLGRKQMTRLFGQFAEMGGAGIEVVSGSQSPDDTGKLSRDAVKYGLRASAGSDFHDPQYPWRELGRNLSLPRECTPIWQDW